MEGSGQVTADAIEGVEAVRVEGGNSGEIEGMLRNFELEIRG